MLRDIFQEIHSWPPNFIQLVRKIKINIESKQKQNAKRENKMFSNKLHNFRQFNHVNRCNQVRKISRTLISRKEHKISSFSNWQNIFEESRILASRPERDSSKTCEFWI